MSDDIANKPIVSATSMNHNDAEGIACLSNCIFEDKMLHRECNANSQTGN